MRMRIGVLMVAAAAANELSDFLPGRALSATHPSDAAAVDWRQVDAVNMAKMTADDMKLLTHCSSVPAALLAKVPPKAFPALDHRCLASMPPATFAALAPAQLEALPSSVVGSLRAASVAALPASSCAAFARSDAFKHYTVEMCAGLQAPCLEKIPPQLRATLKAQSCYTHVPDGEARAILDSTPALPDNQPEAVGALKLAAVGEDVLKGLASCAHLSAADLAAIEPKVYSHMTLACLQTVRPEAFEGINAAQLALVPKDIVLHITKQQVAAMNPKTCALFATTDSFEYLSVSVCTALSETCVKYAYRSLSESPECMSRLPFDAAKLQAAQGVKLNKITDLLPAAATKDAESVRWAEVPAAAFATFTGDDLKLLTGCAGVSAEQISRVEPEVLVDLPPACAAGLSPQAFAALNVKQLYGLSVAAVGSLSARQLAAVPDERCAAFAQSDGFDSLGDAACAGLQAGCISAMRAKDAQKLAARPACAKALSVNAQRELKAKAEQQPALARLSVLPLASCATLLPADVTQQTADAFSLITPGCVASLPPATFAALSVDQLNSIPSPLLVKHTSRAQVDALSNDSCQRLLDERDDVVTRLIAPAVENKCRLVVLDCSEAPPSALAQIKTGLMKAVPPACVKTLSQRAFSSLSSDQLNHLSAAQAAETTPEQMSWLTEQQCSELNGGDFVKYQTGEGCAGLKTACVKLLGLEAFKYLVGSPSCYSHLEPAVRAAIPEGLVARMGLRELTQDEAAKLGLCRLLEASYLQALPGADLHVLPAACVAKLQPAAFAALTAAQLRALGPEAVAALRPEQVAALKPEKCAALEPTPTLAHLTAAACSGFSQQCFSRLGLQTMQAMKAECFAAVAPQVRAALPPQKLALVAAAPTTDGGEKVDRRSTGTSFLVLVLFAAATAMVVQYAPRSRSAMRKRHDDDVYASFAQPASARSSGRSTGRSYSTI